MNSLNSLNKTLERGKRCYSDDGELYRGNYSTYIPLESSYPNALIPNLLLSEVSPCHFNVFVLPYRNNEVFIYMIQSSGLPFYLWTYVISDLSVQVLCLCWVHCLLRAGLSTIANSAEFPHYVTQGLKPDYLPDSGCYYSK